MVAYYNEIDPYCAQWLRNLIKAGHIAPGVVDERSIEDVKPDELQHYTQCHFFAGIGIWSLALRLAGWPDNRPVWTGSCPCQPFSTAGKGSGFNDERHLWPHWFHLVSQCKPATVFGEQVASKDGLGWLDLVQTDMETAEYAFGASDLCSAGVGAPNIRQRLYWVANSELPRLTHSSPRRSLEEGTAGRVEDSNTNSRRGGASRVGDSDGNRCGAGDKAPEAPRYGSPPDPASGAPHGGASRVGHPHSTRLQGRGGLVSVNGTQGRDVADGRLGAAGVWDDVHWLYCLDGKFRPIKPSIEPVVAGCTGRVGRLRAYGNAINAQVAKTFIGAYLNG